MAKVSAGRLLHLTPSWPALLIRDGNVGNFVPEAIKLLHLVTHMGRHDYYSSERGFLLFSLDPKGP